MDPDDLARQVDHYTSLSDEALEEAYAAGQEGYRDPEVWEAIETEFRRREAEWQGGEQAESGEEAAQAAGSVEIDPEKVQQFIQEAKSKQSLPRGILAGAGAAAAGAILWAAVTAMTGYQIGFMALGVGFLVGFAVRAFGNGLDPAFGIAGAALSLVGCLAGNLLAVCILVARQEGMRLFEVLSQLNPAIAVDLMRVTFSPMDVLFYAIAVYEGYRFSFRQVSKEEMASWVRE